eukprot:COSAG04_NODE_594_length_12270_cov_52.568975_7_plen_393_part_00
MNGCSATYRRASRGQRALRRQPRRVRKQRSVMLQRRRGRVVRPRRPRVVLGSAERQPLSLSIASKPKPALKTGRSGNRRLGFGLKKRPLVRPRQGGQEGPEITWVRQNQNLIMRRSEPSRVGSRRVARWKTSGDSDETRVSGDAAEDSGQTRTLDRTQRTTAASAYADHWGGAGRHCQRIGDHCRSIRRAQWTTTASARRHCRRLGGFSAEPAAKAGLTEVRDGNAPRGRHEPHRLRLRRPPQPLSRRCHAGVAGWGVRLALQAGADPAAGGWVERLGLVVIVPCRHSIDSASLVSETWTFHEINLMSCHECHCTAGDIENRESEKRQHNVIVSHSRECRAGIPWAPSRPRSLAGSSRREPTPAGGSERRGHSRGESRPCEQQRRRQLSHGQ